MSPTEAQKRAYAEKHYKTREVSVESKVCEYARKKKVWNRKFKNPGNRGAPDRIFIVDGIVFFIEFKRPKAEPRKQQVLVIDEMVQFGAKVYVTDDYETACGIINDIINFGEA
jgi:hypothetical protein